MPQVLYPYLMCCHTWPINWLLVGFDGKHELVLCFVKCCNAKKMAPKIAKTSLKTHQFNLIKMIHTHEPKKKSLDFYGTRKLFILTVKNHIKIWFDATQIRICVESNLNEFQIRCAYKKSIQRNTEMNTNHCGFRMVTFCLKKKINYTIWTWTLFLGIIENIWP